MTISFKIHQYPILIVLNTLMIFSGCQKSSSDKRQAEKEVVKEVARTSFSSSPGFNIYSLPTKGEFVLPDNTVSFAVIAFSKSNIVFRMQDPSKRHVFADLLKGGFLYASQGSTVLLNPLVPNMPMEKGVWSYSFQNVTTVKMALRTGTVQSTLPIRPIFTGTRFDSADIEGVMAALEIFLKPHGLKVKSLPIRQVPDPQFAAVKPDFQSDLVRRLAEFGDLQSINVFFLEELLEDTNLGIAARIPGTFGIQPLNMVMISLEQHSQLGSDDLQNHRIVQTITHEIGHLVGLFHTTEKTGRQFDPLDDTPKCDEPIYQASVETCDESQGVKNIMFWQYDSNQNQLSPSQVHIFKYSPIAQ